MNVNGVQYHVEIAGAGPPLVLLHGFTGGGANWASFVTRWANRFQVVRMDLLGHGRSAAPPDPERYAMPQAAADLVTLFDALDLPLVNLLGYSMGGRLALYTAVHYSDRFISLILESASPGLETAVARQERIEQDNKLADFIEQEGVAAFVERWESLPLWASQAQLAHDVRANLRRQRLQNNPAGLANSLRGLGTGRQPSLWHNLTALNLSVLLIAGEMDQKFVTINRKMVNLLPHALLQIAPGAGHMVHLERPFDFAAMVENWLQIRAR